MTQPRNIKHPVVQQLMNELDAAIEQQYTKQLQDKDREIFNLSQKIQYLKSDILSISADNKELAHRAFELEQYNTGLVEESRKLQDEVKMLRAALGRQLLASAQLNADNYQLNQIKIDLEQRVEALTTKPGDCEPSDVTEETIDMAITLELAKLLKEHGVLVTHESCPHCTSESNACVDPSALPRVDEKDNDEALYTLGGIIIIR